MHGSLRCWCGGSDARRGWREPHYSVLKCQECGCWQIDPPPITHPDESPPFYRDYYRHSGELAKTGAATSRFWTVAARVKSLRIPGRSVIDVGCGDGDLCAELFRRGWTSVTGIDVATPRVRQARARYPDLAFYDCPISETPLEQGRADLVVMDNVVEHLPDPLTVVRTLATYLAPGARMVLITPNMESGHARLLGRRWTPELAPHVHIFLFTPASLRRLVQDAGLELEALGNFHQAGASLRSTLARLVKGDLKGAAWHILQDLGGWYGRLIGSGPMLYAVARRRLAGAAATQNSSESPVATESGQGLVTGVSVVVCTYRRPESVATLLNSLEKQDAPFHELIVVDASSEEEAGQTRMRIANGLATAARTHYVNVGADGRGLTRQRNAALRLVSGDLLLFLDDDVVLQPSCIREMSEVLRRQDRTVVGVGCCSENQFGPPSLAWRLRRAFGLVRSLQPGRYWRSGISIPWGFTPATGELVDGDWLPGCSMMWRTDVAQQIRFDDTLGGYAQAEDLDFSLRARAFGRLVMLKSALLRHEHARPGRPDAFRLGYMELRNRYEVHRGLPDRTWRDVAWFCYAWSVDTMLLARHLAIPGRGVSTLRQIAGRLAAAYALLLQRGHLPSHHAHLARH